MQDHGPDSIYSYLEGECFEKQIDKYTYKVCGFGSAVQQEGGSDTSLGTFKGCLNGCSTMEYSDVRSHSVVDVILMFRDCEHGSSWEFL
jgi:hypothetical protein